jgi:DNA replication and repair protein RecF
MSLISIQSLELSNFRNYRQLRLSLAAAPVVLIGPNGGGKTNILEAISLLVPGRGLRRAGLTDLQQQGESEAWAVVAELQNPAGFTKLATGLDRDTSPVAKRLARIDGRAVKTQAAFLEHVTISWLTPEQDRVLAEGQSARRKFLDRLVYGFDPAHAGRVTRYEETMRERLRLLRDGIRDQAWLNALEDGMATTGTAIAAARWHMVQQLNKEMSEMTGAFPAATLRLSGLVEDNLQQTSALVTEDVLRRHYAASRDDDARHGTTSIGPQRSDLIVIHNGQGMQSELCSTGEQKALLITIMLCHAALLRRWRGVPPLLLLDDIVSHLDATRREALFEWLMSLECQFWTSGTDEALFAALKAQAQFFYVHQGVKTL